MKTIPAIVHNQPALFIGIISDEHGPQAVYSTVEGSMMLHTTHPSNVVLNPENTGKPDTSKVIRTIKLLREAVDEAARIGNTSGEGRIYLGLADAKRLAEIWLTREG